MLGEVLIDGMEEVLEDLVIEIRKSEEETMSLRELLSDVLIFLFVFFEDRLQLLQIGQLPPLLLQVTLCPQQFVRFFHASLFL